MKKKIKFLLTIIILVLIIFIFIIFNKKQNVNKIYPSVVHIVCNGENTITEGSGIVYDTKDNKQYVVTSYHIIKGYSKIYVYDETNNKEKATVLNYDDKNDIAIITVKNSLNIKKATFDTSNKILKNDHIYILTSIIGKDNSYIVKDGIITNNKEKIDIGGNIFNSIKINYDIENGDSGSPVINKKGKVIGMIFLKDTDELNYGYALPINFVLSKSRYLEIKKNNLNLGAIMTNSSNKKLLDEYNIEANTEGVVILSLKKDYPLSNAGLKKGDIIVSLNNKKIGNVKNLESYLKEYNKYSKVEISYYRNNKLINTIIKLNK